MIANGVPGRLREPEDTARMLSAAAAELWNVIPGIGRAASFLEMFAGSGGASRAVCERGLIGRTFDVRHFACQD
eukprot:6220064-Pyramimonas_sp.AAC.1